MYTIMPILYCHSDCLGVPMSLGICTGRLMTLRVVSANELGACGKRNLHEDKFASLFLN